MKDIKVARQALHDLKTEGRKLIDVIQAEDRLPTSSEETKLRTLEHSAEKASAEVVQIEREMDELRSYPIDYSTPIMTGNPFAQPTYPSRPIRGPQYASLFANAPTVPTNGFQDLNEFLRSVASGLFDNRLVAAATGMGIESGSSAGFIVPTQFISAALDKSLESEIVRSRADVRPMTTNELHVAGWDTTDHSSTIGGFVGRFYAEGDTATVDSGTVRKIILQSKRLQIYTTATNELVDDGGSDFENRLTNAMVGGLGWWMDNSFLTGTGGGEPLGALNVSG